MTLLLIFIGGGLGSISRYGLGTLFPYQGGFPWATFCANLAAAFILGIVMGWLARQNPDAAFGNNMKWLLVTGFCGGFSTFSSFSNETLSMIKQQQWTLAAIYIGLSLLLSISAVAAGLQIKF
jgi:CrcB protein